MTGPNVLDCVPYSTHQGTADPAVGMPARLPRSLRHLDRVVATTMADNTGSWRVLEKCGLRRVRTFYYEGADLMPGAEHGDYVYELTHTDWIRQANRRPSEHGEADPTKTEDGHPPAGNRFVALQV